MELLEMQHRAGGGGGTEPGAAALSLPLSEPGLPSGQVDPMQEGTVGRQPPPSLCPSPPLDR